MTGEHNGTNGLYKIRFDKIDKELDEIKDHLAEAIMKLSTSLDTSTRNLVETQSKLTATIDGLSSNLKLFMDIAQNSIPIKAVFWMFLILVLTIAGVEGIKHLSITKFLSITP